MTTRDDFEKWAGENWIDGLPKMIAPRAWQASRVAALEEFCTMLWDVRKMTGCISSDAVGEIQDAIRALAKGESI